LKYFLEPFGRRPGRPGGIPGSRRHGGG